MEAEFERLVEGLDRYVELSSTSPNTGLQNAISIDGVTQALRFWRLHAKKLARIAVLDNLSNNDVRKLTSIVIEKGHKALSTLQLSSSLSSTAANEREVSQAVALLLECTARLDDLVAVIEGATNTGYPRTLPVQSTKMRNVELGEIESLEPVASPSPPSRRATSSKLHASAVDEPGVDHNDWTVPLYGDCHNSEYSEHSPWARKIILSMDGGGVRGYASLLILHRLMYTVQRIEGVVSEHEVKRCEDRSRYSTSVDATALATQHSEIAEIANREGVLRASGAAYAWASATDRFRYNKEGHRPHHYIDYFVGTGTGGLNAIMLGRLRASVQAAMLRYHVLGREVFARGSSAGRHGVLRPEYKGRYMDKVLQRITAELADRKVGDEKATKLLADSIHLRDHNPDGPRTVVVAHGGQETREVRLFRSYDHPSPSSNPSLAHLRSSSVSNEPLWRVGRATSATPTYLSHAKLLSGKFVDGAVTGNNNPVTLAYKEVTQMHRGFQPKLVISIGTGIKTKTGIAEPQEFSGLNGWNTRKLFKDVVLNTESKHREFQDTVRKYNHGKEPSDPDRLEYFRFNVPDSLGLAAIKFGEWKGGHGSETISKINRAVEAYLEMDEIGKHLNDCAQIMVDIRRRRQATARWESFAHQVQYHCPERGEHCKDRMYASRVDLRRHAIRDHSFVWQARCVEREQEKDIITHDWACYWGPCGARSVSVFKTKDDFLRHLKLEHKTHQPVFVTVKQFEDWLDKGRWQEGRTPVATTFSRFGQY